MHMQNCHNSMTQKRVKKKNKKIKKWNCHKTKNKQILKAVSAGITHMHHTTVKIKYKINIKKPSADLQKATQNLRHFKEKMAGYTPS